MPNISYNMHLVHLTDHELLRAWKSPNAFVQVDLLEHALFSEDSIIELSLYSAAVSRFTITVSWESLSWRDLGPS